MITNWVVISDLHCGCQMGLCPPRGVRLDGGGRYRPNATQREIWRHWAHFWDIWVPHVVRDEPYGVILNGDAIDGRHHNATTQISHNLADQLEIAKEVLDPIAANAKALYLIRGTEAHVGPSGETEEQLGEILGAKRDGRGRYARDELWLRIGDRTLHALHHIGTTGAQAYEATAVHKERVEMDADCARWHGRPADVVIRSHRHRFLMVTIPTANVYGYAVTTPAWQGKNGYAYRMAGARLSSPQIGGILVRRGDEDLYVRSYVASLTRPREERA